MCGRYKRFGCYVDVCWADNWLGTESPGSPVGGAICHLGANKYRRCHRREGEVFDRGGPRSLSLRLPKKNIAPRRPGRHQVAQS